MDWYGFRTKLEGGFTTTLAGTVSSGPITGDKNKPVATYITGDKNNPVGSQVTGDVTKPIALRFSGDQEKPVASTVDLLNLPHLTLDDIKDIMTPKVRMHIPNYQQMSFKLLGVELFTWCMSGESEIITQPYTPNRFEECRIECPDEDLRPFPRDTPVHKDQK